jgi:hypothetical protein
MFMGMPDAAQRSRTARAFVSPPSFPILRFTTETQRNTEKKHLTTSCKFPSKTEGGEFD